MQIDRPITIAIALFIVILLVSFFVVPQYNEFQSLQTQLGEKKAEYNAKFDYYAQIAKTYDELQTQKSALAKIDQALPILSESPTFGKTIYYLQDTAKSSGLVIKDLFLSQSGANSGQGNVRDIAFSLSMIGGYSSLQNFITALEKSSRIFEVYSISFGSELDPPYSFSVQIKTHSY